MSGSQNRGSIAIDANGNWRLYTNSIPAGCTVLGTVTRDGLETGALVQTEAGIYSMLNARVYRGLDQKKVAAALGHAEIAFHTTSGLIQYAASIEAMLEEYNRNGDFHEVRTDADGSQILWHKGHRRAIGTFKPANRG